MKFTLLAILLAIAPAGGAVERPHVELTLVAPVRFETRGGAYFVDFGKDAYGTLAIEFPSDPPATRLTVRLGEKLRDDGTIDRHPFGSLAFVETALSVEPGRRSYQLAIPSRKRVKSAVPTPPEVGEVTPLSDTQAVPSWPSRLTKTYPVCPQGRTLMRLLSRMKSPRSVRTISTAWPSS